MNIAKVEVSGIHACVVSSSPIPAGIIGAQISFEYKDPLWEGLSKTVVFTCGAVTKDVLDAGDTVTIPAEVVTKPGTKVRVGVYGTTADGILAVPTLWADIGLVHGAADPSGDESTDPQLPVWAQIQNVIDDLKRNGAGGGSGATFTPHVSDDGELSWTNDRDLGNPEPVNIKGPQGNPGERGLEGPQGPQGEMGLSGKSAYEYAQDAGYSGTEDEFAKRLATSTYSKSEIDTMLGSYITDIDTLIGGDA